MPLKVITPEGNKVSIHSPEDFEKAFAIRYLSKLEFADAKTQLKIEKKCAKALRKEWITSRQKWLGHYYSEGLHGAVHLDLTIAWINDAIGYGVFTNRPIPMNTFIGEYTGILRKRHFFGRWKNLYCFDYNIGEGRRSSFVIDAEKHSNHTRFINHSYRANLEPVSIYCDGLVHVILYAREAIEAGEQLCYDYGKDYWKKRGAPLKLHRA